MVNQIKTFITAVIFILTLTGCGNDIKMPESNLPKECPDFTASIDKVHSRAFESQWESGDQIGISGEGRTNVCYRTADGDGTFAVKNSGTQIYFQSDDEVTFTAYYPWNDLAEGTSSINADIRDQHKNLDFLWAQASGKKTKPNVAFNFTHRMAKVVFTVQPGKGVSFDEIKSSLLSIGGFRYAGYFNINDGVTSADDASVSDKWIFADKEKNVSYITVNENSLTCSLFLFPQVLDTPLAFMAEIPNHSLMAKIDFTSANREKDGDGAKNEWVAGRQYNLSLTIHKSEITLERCVITPWNDVSSDEIEVD